MKTGNEIRQQIENAKTTPAYLKEKEKLAREEAEIEAESGSVSGAAPCSVRDLNKPSGAWSRTDFVREYDKLIAERDTLRKEVAKWKKDIIPFLAVHAGIYGRDHYGDNCMHYTHYDLLKEAGGRMTDFKRCGDE